MKPASTSNEAAWDAHSSDDQVKPKSSDDQRALSEIENGLRRDIVVALKGLQFGEITITVREGRVVQIERIARSKLLVPKRNG